MIYFYFNNNINNTLFMDGLHKKLLYIYNIIPLLVAACIYNIYMPALLLISITMTTTQGSVFVVGLAISFG